MLAPIVRTFFTTLSIVISMTACAGVPGVGDLSWKEEVLLHDGRTIFVTRRQSFGGRHEIGTSPPARENAISFKLPNTAQAYTWTSEFDVHLGRTNFHLLALHVLNETPYLVTMPNLCLAYNKWGRPNPPYILFKNDGKSWRQIPLSELPVEFNTINLIVNIQSERQIKELERPRGYVTEVDVKKANRELRQPEYQSILREERKVGAKNSQVDCEEMFFDGHDSWRSKDMFEHSSQEECTQFCTRSSIAAEFCKCFITKKEK